MQRTVIALTCILSVACVQALADTAMVDDFLSSPDRIQDLKTLSIIILAQADPANAAKHTAELRRNFWAARPEAGLTPAEAEVALKAFDSDWAEIGRAVQERGMKSIAFVGLDFVLAKKAQDWYFGYPTPRGPILIKISVQFNDDMPLTIHGVQVWTKWDDIKAVSHAIQFPAGSKLFTATYEGGDVNL